jgi:hypothetical protein
MIFLKRSLSAMLAVLLSALSACGSLNLRDDYELSRKKLSQSMIADARETLPTGERGSFISTMEEAYISLLDGIPEIDALYRYAKKIDDQVQYKVTREAGNFFYVVTPEDYYASEHEIVWMHCLLSWGFSMRGQFDDARVEAKIASNLLSMKFSPKGRFDDPFVRVFLASLWAMAGDWEEARVDLRAAAELDAKMSWAKQLAALDEKPADFTLILCGTGPEVEWNPSAQPNIIRGVRSIGFKTSGQKRTLSMLADGKPRELHMTSDSSAWYVRHFKRNNEISSVIDDSKYTQRMAGTALKAAGISAGGILLGAVIIAGGLSLGALVAYIGLEGSSGEVLGAGLIIMGGGVIKGGQVAGDSFDYAGREVRTDLDISPSYRYVRFLPEYAWLSWSAKKTSSFVIGAKDAAGNTDISSIAKNAKIVGGVRILFYPDAL